jgi:hypothetical protein
VTPFKYVQYLNCSYWRTCSVHAVTFFVSIKFQPIFFLGRCEVLLYIVPVCVVGFWR